MSDPLADVTWFVEPAKIVRYLLDPHHKQGASKAKYLLSFGFSAQAPEALAATLVRQATAQWPGRIVVPTRGPRRVVFEGTVEAPDGRLMTLRTVWEFTSPAGLRLITAVPLTR